MNNCAFSALPLPESLLHSLQILGYTQMTAIQARSLPPMLNGQDIIAQGQTGSGKTVAFSLNVLHKLNVKYFRVQALVLCPTRELADQVAAEIRKLARSIHNIKVLTLCGGSPVGPQIGSLEHGAHIIVGTPGRIVDHLEKGRLSLQDLTTLVLDEADRMLEMGFQDALETIIQHAPKQRQTLLFSATYPPKIQDIAASILHNPVSIQVEADQQTNNITQRFFQVADNHQRLDALHKLLLQQQPQSSIVFCNTKRDTQDIATALADYGFSVLALHGDLEQKDRDQTLVRFANRSACILVATDVAARGLDIDAVDAVFNYQLAHDAETHIHRIGRTGRAGNSGIAFSLFTASDAGKLLQLEDLTGTAINSEALPDDKVLQQQPLQPEMATIQLDGGKKQKLRPGDIVGALTNSKQLTGDDIGRIQVYDIWSYIAVKRNQLKLALQILQQGKIKGKSVRVRTL
ncbi:ATP-dependent RNA helicase DbpA [Chromatiaceae bacterium AAb-1]|nr:ATP-dependent RNA helicase DbpA [Chromatiaceae bacterium AAb-1]